MGEYQKIFIAGQVRVSCGFRLNTMRRKMTMFWPISGYFSFEYFTLGELCTTFQSTSFQFIWHSCSLYNLDTVRDNFTKLGTNVKHDKPFDRN